MDARSNPHLVAFCPLSPRPQHAHPSRSVVSFTIPAPRQAQTCLGQWSPLAIPPHYSALQVPGRRARQPRRTTTAVFEVVRLGVRATFAEKRRQSMCHQTACVQLQLRAVCVRNTNQHCVLFAHTTWASFHKTSTNPLLLSILHSENVPMRSG